MKLHQECPAKPEMKNHEEPNESRDEWRESTPQRSSRPLVWVFMKKILDAIRRKLGGKKKVRFGEVVEFEPTLTKKPRFDLGFLLRMGSNFTASPKRTCLLQISLRFTALKIFCRMAGSMMPSPSKNLSLTLRWPPCFTSSPRPEWNFAPNFSL